MKDLLDRTTCLIVASALALTLLCLSPSSRDVFPFWAISAGAHIANTLFHELGHTVFSWLFGQPAVPMIFTLFGADQAGGMSMYWPHSWFVQIAAFAALGYACYWSKENIPCLFVPSIIFSLLIVLAACAGYQRPVIAYMGHGGSILMGGFFLFRAWLYLDSRNQYERWLNAFFGFFLILSNFYFSYRLAFNYSAQADYVDHTAFGIAHNDFFIIAMLMPGWSVKGIALFTMGYCIAMIAGSFICAWCWRNIR